MKRLLILALSVGFLGGCATLQAAGQLICKNDSITAVGLEMAREKALLIQDDSQRAAAVKAIDVALSALDTCHAPR